MYLLLIVSFVLLSTAVTAFDDHRHHDDFDHFRFDDRFNHFRFDDRFNHYPGDNGEIDRFRPCYRFSCPICSKCRVNDLGSTVCLPTESCCAGNNLFPCNACSLQTCSKYPSAICVQDACGGCRARFFHETSYQELFDCI